MRSPTRTLSRGGNDLIDDARTFTRIFEAEFRQRLYYYALHHVRNRQEAEDAVSDTYVRVLRKICESGIRKVTLTTYLFTATRNRCIDFLRSNRGDEISIDRLAHEAEDREVFSEVIGDEAIGCLLELLPEDYRLPVLLCDLQDFPARLAAEVVGISVPALKSRLYRGRNALRGLMVREGIVPPGYLDVQPDRSKRKARRQPSPSPKEKCVNPMHQSVNWRYASGVSAPAAPTYLLREGFKLTTEPEVTEIQEAAQPVTMVLSAPSPVLNGHLNGRRDPASEPIEGAAPKRRAAPRPKPVTKEFFGPKGLFDSLEALATAILAQDEYLGSPKELSGVLFMASRRRRKRQTLSNKIRAIVIDLIFDLVDNDDRRARKWVRILTAEFPPASDTPDHLYLH